jgi:hypothetical protein
MLPNIDAFVTDDLDEDEFGSSSDDMPDGAQQEAIVQENAKRAQRGMLTKKGLTKSRRNEILKKKKLGTQPL